MSASKHNISKSSDIKTSDSHVAQNASVQKISFTEPKFQELVTQMTNECLTHNSDTYKVHLARLKGLKIINRIIRKADKSYITFQNIVQLVWCILSCVHHFQIRLCQSKSYFSIGKWRQSQDALQTFDLMIQTFQEMDYLVLKSILKFFKEAKLWGNEFMSHDLLTRFLAFTTDRSAVIYELLTLCEECTSSEVNSIVEAREILRIVDKLFEDYQWGTINETLLEKLFQLFFSSIDPDTEDEDTYLSIQKGLEVCLRHVLESLHNHDLMLAIKMLLKWVIKEGSNESILLEIGSMLEYAAMNYRTKLFKDSLPSDVIDSLLNLISSKNMLQSLLGNRVMHYLVDRCNNRLKFDTPRIFYQNSRYNIIVNSFHEQDKQFLQKHREAFHASLLTAIMTHGMRQINLESSYTLIALFVVEIPCAYTAAAAVCLAMAIQEATFDNESFNMNQSHRLHATVMAIMSLTCYIFNAKIFYDYLNTIIDRRAEFAPHLNPPLKRIYEYNQHHVHWDKPELFFEDWEARYGLWKCFKRDDPTRPSWPSGLSRNFFYIRMLFSDLENPRVNILVQFPRKFRENLMDDPHNQDFLVSSEQSIRRLECYSCSKKDHKLLSRQCSKHNPHIKTYVDNVDDENRFQ